MMKRAFFLIMMMAATGVPLLTAQANEILDAILGEAALSYANAAYLVGTASGHLPETITPADAVPGLEQAGFGLPGRQPTDPVTLGDFSYMLARSFGMHGGIMYSILPGPRYATRELSFLGIISGPAKPSMSISGERALRILEQVLHRKEAAK
ncbi:MAG: hypothetical protein ABSG63_00385 [Spirochaetia bacterium]|jgi:hypothetical protein